MSSLFLWRTELQAGDFTYAWTPEGSLPVGTNGSALGGDTFSLDNSIPLTQSYLGRTQCYWDTQFATALHAPAETPPGTYSLYIRGKKTGNQITILPPARQRSTLILQPAIGADSSAAIQTALDQDHNVLLAPGVFTIGHEITIPAGAWISGQSPSLTVLRRSPSDDYGNRFFTARGGGFTISDLSFEGPEGLSPICIHAVPGIDMGCVNLRRICCTNTANLLAGEATGSHVNDITLDRVSGAQGSSHQLWRNIRVVNVGPGGNEFIVGGDQRVLIDIDFQNTGRGMIFRQGPTNSYFNSLTFAGINSIANGSEILLVEDVAGSSGLVNCLIFHVDIRDCCGAVEFWVTPTINNQFRDFRMAGGGGILFCCNGAEQSHNTFTDFELRGCVGIQLDQALWNTFTNIAIISPRPTSSNQRNVDPVFFKPRAVIQARETNKFNKVQIIDAPQGWTHF